MTKEKKRVRRVRSIGDELIEKSREAALAAVQIFNNPQITFKSELFIVTMSIAWTYLLHAYFRKQKIEYRYFKEKGERRIFDRTKGGAFKHWELERCLNDGNCPLDKDTSNNLRFLIGIRHEIEHQMTNKIDESLSAKFQACCLNYNKSIKKIFGDDLGIEKHLSFSLQFSSISKVQVDQLTEQPDLPPHIRSYILSFESSLSPEEYNSPSFAYRVFFIPKTANHKGQADQVIEFVKADSELASQINRSYAVIKETERPKFTASQIVAKMRSEGYTKFRLHEHSLLWKEKDAKNPNKGFGTQVATTWYWYETWLNEVATHCAVNKGLYS